MTFLNKKFLLILFSVILIFASFAFLSDKALTVREFEIENDKIPSAFDGFRIAQISDLHNATFGEANSKLIETLKSTSPDIIVVTGDIIDSRRTDISIAENFLTEAMEIAPVYYVTGNHESRVNASDDLFSRMKSSGVIIAENESFKITRNSQSITLCGIKDPAFTSDYLLGYESTVVEKSLEQLPETETFRILLSHRPEFFDLYVEHGFDLVFSGHAHGGQFRLPFIGGLVAPGQGLFPKYDSGLYKEKSTSMIVSRGLGNSIIPIRFNNRPEIIVAVLKEAE